MTLTPLVACALALAADPSDSDSSSQPAPFRPSREWTEHQRLLLSLPDPATATMKSAVIGFGAGHAYACQPNTAAAHGAVQLLTVGGLVGATIWSVESPAKFQNNDGPVVLGVLAGMLVAERLLDLGTASASANVTSHRVLSGLPSCIK